MADKAPIIIDLNFHPEEVRRGLTTAFPGRKVINRSDPADAGSDLASAHYALLWKPKADLFIRATGLKVLFSGGAGVDSVLSLPGLPDLPLVRFVDPTLTTRMSEWVVMQCLLHLRQHVAYERQRARHIWNPLVQPEAADVTVGIMGLGVLGADAARKLKAIGFKVRGWSKTAKAIDGVESFSEADLDQFLAGTDILVGLLPLTPETRGIFNAGLFARLRKGGALGAPVFINAGRGGSQVEADILAALDAGVLKGVSLDVFETEPLPPTSPFWDRDTVMMTPHTAADSDVAALFRHVEHQIDQYEAGEPLEHLVDRDRAY